MITGVSSGIGAALAKVFRDNGDRVVGVSRSEPDSGRDDWVQCDLTHFEQRRELKGKILEKVDCIDILINNAGVGIYDRWEDADPEDIRQVFELNFFSAVELTRLLLPIMKTPGGIIVNMSSVAARMSVVCMGAYCASKYAVHAWSDSMRMELYPKGIDVLEVLPGRISTGFSKRAKGGREHPETPGSVTPERLATAVLKAVNKRKKSIVFPWWYRLLMPIPRLAPGLYRKINLKKWKVNDEK